MSDQFFSLALDNSDRRQDAALHEEQPYTPITTKKHHQQTDSEDHPTNDNARIEDLAKPKKSCVSVPVRFNQKKKVVAFGHTTNFSQTVEGTSSRAQKHQHISPATMHNKENVTPITSQKKATTAAAKTETPILKPKTKELQHDTIQDLLEQMFAKQEKKFEQQISILRKEIHDLRETQKAGFEHIKISQNHVSPEDKLQAAFRTIEHEIAKDPSNAQIVRKWYHGLKTTGNNSQLDSIQRSRAYSPVPVERRERSPGTPKQQTLKEKMRASPSFSLDTRQFLNRSNLLQGSPSVAEFQLSGLKSVVAPNRKPAHYHNNANYDFHPQKREHNLPTYRQVDSYFEDTFDDEESYTESAKPVNQDYNETRKQELYERALKQTNRKK